MTPTIREILIAVTMSAFTAWGVYYKVNGEVESSEIASAANMASSQQVQTKLFLDRMQTLEFRIDTLQSDLTKLAIENAELKADNAQQAIKIGILQSQINYGEGSNVQTIFELLESLRTPAWCKAWVAKTEEKDAHFEMAYINAWYELKYNVSKAFYIGSTDFDVHPVHIAQAFTENDLRTYSARAWMDFTETVTDSHGLERKKRFWKFYHKVGNGPEMVCGWEVP